MTGPVTRAELTAALAVRQMLDRRRRLTPAAAIAQLTPLQAQHPPAPYLALAARLEGFAPPALEAALGSGVVVKATLMRFTLHLAAAGDFPAYAQISRQARLRGLARRHPGLDLDAATADLRAWLTQPRGNDEIRALVAELWPEIPGDPWTPIGFVRDLVPVVHLPPAGFWAQRRRPRFTVDPRPRPERGQAAADVLAGYLRAFGPASLRDAAAWAGVAQRDLAGAVARLPVLRERDERGRELLDLPGAPRPPASAPLPVRLLAHWDQPLLAYADRERVMPAELRPLQLTLSGDPTVTVDGRVAGRWSHAREGGVCRLAVEPLVELARVQLGAVRAEALRTARFCAGADDRVEVTIAG